ncbi:glycosyltransferase family 4 protein [Pseudomonas sp. G(2018)]|uniref:glycosyltransferase family 4 protein n=1 Tax=Pseudomonas sp. G(2018) TaxID=2502242 RepID=UPI0010FA34C3|nr:glycosyltransferase family 4 protein [Pseudomonas sp. G(2018)]
MKIIHLCLSCFYIDNYRYQENELVREHVADGHEVLVVASTESYVDNLTLGYVAADEYMGSDGAKVIRLPYVGPVPFFLKKKLRMHPGVANILKDFSPDVIMFHGLCGWELLTVAQYKRANPHVRLYVDSHEDANNSAVGKLSQVLHRYYYRPIIRRALPWIDKVLCISLETIEFCKRQYAIPMQDMEFFPLGGYIADDVTYQSHRTEGRAALNLQEDQTVFLQSGKFDSKKKLIESLTAFTATHSEKLRFLIVGRVHESIEQQVAQFSSADPRIQYLGWKTADELYRLLCAVDVYVQPGSQSATMQMSICARCPVVIADVPSHEPFVKGNGWKVSNQEQLSNAFASIEKDPSVLSGMSQRSLEIAYDLLEYRRMAKRLLV